MYELIIIGGGPAGLTAAVYAARKGLNFLLITKNIGGQAVKSSDIENYLGYHHISGEQLVERFEEHLRDYRFDFREDEEVTAIEKKNEDFIVRTDKGEYETRAIIIATGRKPRKLSSKKLNVPGEDRLGGRGLSYCATCDAPLFRNKVVAVIGGGNSALDAAIQLGRIASKIYIINIGDKLTGDEVMQRRALETGRVEVINRARTTEILGDKFVTGLKYEQDGEEKELKVDGVFVEIGAVPSTDFADFLEKNRRGEILINMTEDIFTSNMTSVEGIFAAGDCTNIPHKQVIVAAGEGAKAAISASAWLSRHKKS